MLNPQSHQRKTHNDPRMGGQKLVPEKAKQYIVELIAICFLNSIQSSISSKAASAN